MKKNQQNIINLVAVMLVQSITHLLTLNSDDFTNINEIVVVHL